MADHKSNDDALLFLEFLQVFTYGKKKTKEGIKEEKMYYLADLHP
jgi:lipoate-protein ligase B